MMPAARSPALAGYLAASRLAGPLAAPILSRRTARGKENPERIGERLGRAGLPRPDGALIWLHGASVGEATSALPLIAALMARTEAQVLLTTGTVTSAKRMAAALPEGAVHQFVPVDTLGAVRRFLGHWRPDLAIWVESELWPRLVVETARRRIPMALINARLSERSLRRWQRVPAMAARLLGSFRVIVTQDHATVERLRALGAVARYGGNLKALVPVPGCAEAELAAIRAALDGRPVWLAASTHAGEEEVALAAQARLSGAGGPLLILAPRHPERGGKVARLVADAGLSGIRRSAGGLPEARRDVWLADTLGEMGLWYRLAPVAFIGGSLVPAGGHTPFEPVQLGSVVLHGPHVANFEPAYAALDAARAAIRVGNADEIAAEVGRLLADPGAAGALADAARAVHDGLKPDVACLAAELVGLMEESR